MEEDFPESPQCSKTDSLQDLNLDRPFQDQHNLSPESVPQDQDQQSLQSGLDQTQDKHSAQAEGEEQVQGQVKDQDLTGVGEEAVVHQNQDLSGGAEDPDGGVPALLITAAEETLGPGPATPVGSAEPAEPHRPADLVISGTPSDPLSFSSDGGDMTCLDLLSLRSDSFSLASEPTASRTSEDDDSRSVTASSIMSLFHRVQLDPLEKDWLRSSAVGDAATQRLLLSQESGLVLKKTALHWAAKQGRQEVMDMMLRSGADVNVKSGYTALHLASIHGHQHIVQTLINTYNAKTTIRDYHGKTAVHYWSGGSDVFNRPDCPSGGSFSRGRQTQRYVLPSLLLSRSRSQGQLNLDFGKLPQSASHDVLDLQV